MATHSHAEPHNHCRHSEAHCHIELHVAVVDVAKFCQHPPQVECIDQQPGEDTEPEIVEEYGHNLARKVDFYNLVVILGCDDKQELGGKEGENDEPVDRVGVGRQPVEDGEGHNS